MPTSKNQWSVIGRGFNGWHAQGGGISSSGGDLVDRPWHAGGVQTGYLTDAVEGALVYDASEADTSAFVKLVMNGPMVATHLPPDAVDRFSMADRDAALRMAPGLGGGFKTLAVLAQSETFTGLDRVGVAVYEKLLRQVPGVKIGKVKAGAVCWEG